MGCYLANSASLRKRTVGSLAKSLRSLSVEFPQKSVSQFERVGRARRQIEVYSANDVSHHTGQSRDQLREVPERRGLGVWLPWTLVAGYPLEQASCRG